MTQAEREPTVEGMHLGRKDTAMTTQHPAKRRSALVAVAPAIGIEIAAISVNAGGAVSATLGFLVCFAACHQIRLARWRHRIA
jgi:hypothetical protein